MKVFLLIYSLFRAKIHAQAQRVKSAGGRGNKKSESSDEEYEDESDVPIQVPF